MYQTSKVPIIQLPDIAITNNGLKLKKYYLNPVIGGSINNLITTTENLKLTLYKIKWTKKGGILIIGVCVIGILLNIFVRYYRGTWIYRYGNLISLFLFYGGVLWSLVNTVALFSKYKNNLKSNIIWIILSALPVLYLIAMIVIAFVFDYELEQNF